MANTWLDHWLLNAMQKMTHPAGIRFKYPEPSVNFNHSSSQSPAIRINDRKTLLALLLNPEINFGDLYCEGRIEIEGDLVRSLEKLYQVPEQTITKFISMWLNRMQAGTLTNARKNIHHHYDLPSDFYQLWLDPQMVYTCAYFRHEHASLQEAQSAKMELVCRKLWLVRVNK